MSGGIEDRIATEIEQATNTPFDPPDVDSGEEVSNVDTGQRDTEQDQLSTQLRNRQPNQQQADRQNLADPQAKAKQEDGKRGDPKKNVGDKPLGGEATAAAAAKRMYGQLERQRSITKQYQDRNVELSRQLADIQFLADQPRQLGLSNDEVHEALQLTAQFKANPVAAARGVIERAIAAGASLHQIIDDQFIPDVSINATQRLLDQRLGKQGNQQQPQGVDPEVKLKVDQFLVDYPDAEVNQEIVAAGIARLIDNYAQRGITKYDPYLVAERAFEEFLRFCEVNGFDHTQPVKPQVIARQQGQQRPNVPAPGQTKQPARQQPSRPMPRGGNGGDVIERRSRSNSADDSYDAIIRETMREAGYSL